MALYATFLFIVGAVLTGIGKIKDSVVSTACGGLICMIAGIMFFF